MPRSFPAESGFETGVEVESGVAIRLFTGLKVSGASHEFKELLLLFFFFIFLHFWDKRQTEPDTSPGCLF